MKSNTPNKSKNITLYIAALGIVYGDIGTSPLYALKEVFVHAHVPLTQDAILGVLSLIFWTLTIVVSLKYVYLILRADNHGEGGLISMMTLAMQAVPKNTKLRRTLLLLGLFGAALFCGDGIITPAVSVLSAVEGLSLISPDLEKYIIPITLVILVVLFSIQRKGTAGIARFFGPIMLLWFVVLGLLGINQIVRAPEVLQALNPAYAISFFLQYKTFAFLALGAVVLCVTGAEALYADMGHFGKRPIRIAWYFCAMPGLVLNYFGQGAFLLPADITQVGSPFFQMAPSWALIPLVCLATAATIIASQALITGAFSAIHQAIQMGFLPYMRVIHTSIHHTGQIYIPLVNWCLFAGIVLVVVFFKSSTNLAGAYGIAVTMQMLITTLMSFFVIRYGYKYNLWLCLAVTAFFLCIDALYFGANIIKIMDGGWLPIIVAAFVFIVMLTWMQGAQALKKVQHDSALKLQPFLDQLFNEPPQRAQGCAIFLSDSPDVVPSSLLHNLKHNRILHDVNLFVYVQRQEVPWVGFEQRIEVQSLKHDCWLITLNYGFKNEINIPDALGMLSQQGLSIENMQKSYFLSRTIIVPEEVQEQRSMALWRERLFASLYRNAEGAALYYSIPNGEVIEIGEKVSI